MKLLSPDTIRRCFIADPGYSIFSADFDQIEWRILGALAGEQSIIDAARKGVSIHILAATNIFGTGYTADQYRFCKNLNFGWGFGGGPATLSAQTGVPIDECIRLIKEYEKGFPALVAYKRREQTAVLKAALTPNQLKMYYGLRNQMYALRGDTVQGRAAKAMLLQQIEQLLYRKIARITTPTGRRLVVDAAKAYTVVNYKVQSTAADIMKQALLDVMDDPELEPTVLLPIHDEILGQAPKRKAERIAARYGEVMSCKFMGVPITASGKVYGQSWGHGYRKDS